MLLFVAFRFIQEGDLFYVLPCVILFLCFSVLLALRLPRLGKRELILVLFVRLFDLCLFGFLFLLVSGKGCGLWLWHSLDFYLTFFILSLALCFVVAFFEVILASRLLRLGKRELRAFVCFACVGLCLFSLPLDVRIGCDQWLWHFLHFCFLLY